MSTERLEKSRHPIKHLFNSGLLHLENNKVRVNWELFERALAHIDKACKRQRTLRLRLLEIDGLLLDEAAKRVERWARHRRSIFWKLIDGLQSLDYKSGVEEEDLSDIEVTVERTPHRISTQNPWKFLWLVGKGAKEGAIDRNLLIDAIKKRDLNALLEISQSYARLAKKPEDEELLRRILTVMSELLQSERFRKFAEDPEEQKKHAAEIGRRGRCPRCGTMISGLSCQCGWKCDTFDSPRPIPVKTKFLVRVGRYPLLVFYKQQVVLNPHHPLIQVLMEHVKTLKRG